MKTLNRWTGLLVLGFILILSLAVTGFAQDRAHDDAQVAKEICGDTGSKSIETDATGSTIDCVVDDAISAPPQLTTAFIGFYVDKHTGVDHHTPTEGEDYKTETMGYMGIDYALAQSRLDAFGVGFGYRGVDPVTFSERYMAAIPDEELSGSFDKMIAAVRTFLQAGDKSCPSCGSLTLPAPSTYLADDGWGSEDRLHFVLGLETPSPDFPGALRSGLGAFTFDGNGTFVAESFREYNFSRYLTEDLIADLEITAEGLKR